MVSTPADHPRARLGWNLLTVLLALETIFLCGVLYVSVGGAIDDEGFLLQSVSIVVLVFGSLLWVGATLVGALRSRVSWVRASAVTIHVLLFAAGTGCLQVGIGAWWLGWALVLTALVGFVAAILAVPDARAPAQEGAGDPA